MQDRKSKGRKSTNQSKSLVQQNHLCSKCRTDIFPALFHLPFNLKIFTIVWKNIVKPVFVAVQDSRSYAGTKLCLNDHYLWETFCLGWTVHHCNTIPMWGLIPLLVLIEHLSQLAWMPTYGTAIRDTREQFTWTHCYDMSLTVTVPCPAGVTSKTTCERQPCPTWLLALAGLTTNGQLVTILYITWFYFTSQSYVSMFLSLPI